MRPPAYWMRRFQPLEGRLTSASWKPRSSGREVSPDLFSTSRYRASRNNDCRRVAPSLDKNGSALPAILRIEAALAWAQERAGFFLCRGASGSHSTGSAPQSEHPHRRPGHRENHYSSLAHGNSPGKGGEDCPSLANRSRGPASGGELPKARLHPSPALALRPGGGRIPVSTAVTP